MSTPKIGTDIVLLAGGKPFAHCTTNSMSIARSTREISSKDTDDWEAHEYSKGSGSFEFSALKVYDHVTASQNGFWEIIDGLIAKTKYTIKYGSITLGEYHLEATVLITDIKSDDPNSENSTYSGTFKMSGAPTKVLNAS